MSAKRLTPEQREAIIKDIKARKLTFRRIAHKHQVSSATVSTLAEREGLRRPRKTTPKTTPATPAPDNSYDRSQRISALDRMLNSIDKMVEQGGLSTGQLKDLASAASSVYATRRSEDIEPVEEKKQDATFWLKEFATEDSPGLPLDLNTEVGRRMYAFGLAMEEAGDIDDWGALNKREQEITDEMNARAKAAEAERHDDG